VLWKQPDDNPPENGNALMESSFSTPYHDVTERAREHLRQSPHQEVRAVSCEFDRGVLRLRGRLSSFYHKQLAQEAVARLTGVREVVNEVVVAM
jgi:osmotically-inducible protein OsmY